MVAMVNEGADLEAIDLLLWGVDQDEVALMEPIARDLDQRLVLAQDLDDLLSQSEGALFSALLIDVDALGLDLVSLIETLLHHRQWRQLPLLLLSTTADLSFTPERVSFDVLFKPTSTELLRGKLSLLLRAARQAQRIAKLEAELSVAQKNLIKSERQLRRTNEEMSQFAYIASHDLREPLRMVSSFMELLQDRYQIHLDEQARKFIFYAVDGAVRMQNMINGIVEFNQLRPSAKTMELVSVNMIVEAALINLSPKVCNSEARLTRDELPDVVADRAHLTQVFEALLDNAIKFRSERPLEVHIGAQRADDAWIFSISDNGIGFDETQSKRVFALFQTLHERDQFPGNGKGLAMAKKIIESYGGEIWVAAVSSQGSKFDFRWPIDASVDAV